MISGGEWSSSWVERGFKWRTESFLRLETARFSSRMARYHTLPLDSLEETSISEPFEAESFSFLPVDDSIALEQMRERTVVCFS